MLRRLAARAFWRFSRWTLHTQPAPTQPTILIGAPHTSNWDFVYMMAINWQEQLHVRWLGKHTLFRSWYGPLFRAAGGIPVDRRNPRDVVGNLLAEMESGTPFNLVITPDGTRTNRADYWKSGFYRIARATGMPVTLGFIDRPNKRVGLGPTIDMTGDVKADMDRIRAFYADKLGWHPQRRVEPRLRDETAHAG